MWREVCGLIGYTRFSTSILFDLVLCLRGAVTCSQWAILLITLRSTGCQEASKIVAVIVCQCSVIFWKEEGEVSVTTAIQYELSDLDTGICLSVIEEVMHRYNYQNVHLIC